MQRTVLVVDDDRSIRSVISINLVASGFIVLEAENGEEGLELAQGQSVDIVLLDVMMPGKSGWEVAGALRERGMPFLFMSAKAGRDDQVRGVEAGALDYITKPFNPVRLGARLDELLEAVDRGQGETVRRQRLESLLAGG